MKRIMFYLIFISTVATRAQTTITFLHFNDLHAHLTMHTDVVPDTDFGSYGNNKKIVMRGGLSRLKTLIDNIRSSTPNTIAMNIGDTFHGGVEALYTTGNAIMGPVNAIGFDVGVPGNWDFAFGPGVFRKRYTNAPVLPIMQQMLPDYEILRPNFPYIASNVTFTMPSSYAGQTILPPTMIKEIGGLKIGFIGITSDIVPQMYAFLALGFDFLQGEENYKNLINLYARELRNSGADIIVVLSELGIHKDFRLAQIVDPGIAVFFSAHTHEVTYEPLTSYSGALVVEAGNDGYLGRMDITFNNNKITNRTWELIPITPNIPENPQMAAIIDSVRTPFLETNVNMVVPNSNQRLNLPINSVVGYTEVELDRRNALASDFNNLFASWLKESSGTDLALTPGFRYDSPLAAAGALLEDNTVSEGAITLEDVYRYFPVQYTLATAEIQASTFRNILEGNLTNVFSKDYFSQGGGWMDGTAGIYTVLNLNNNDGERIHEMRFAPNDAVIPDDTILTITGCQRPFEPDDVLCSYQGFVNKHDYVNPVTNEVWTPVDFFVSKLKEKNITMLPSSSFKDQDNTLLWPAAAFVQPLDIQNITGIDSDNNSGLPSQLALYQNYPNPFNPTTIISYETRNHGFVKLNVYDVLGRLIKVLVNEEQPAGIYKLEFDASNLASGIYYYSLITSKEIQTKNMVLIK